MSDDRIVQIALDRKTLVSRSPEVEHERAVAIYDLLEKNLFVPVGDFTGPFRVELSLQGANRLIFDIQDESENSQGVIAISLTPFQRIIRDYYKICESYFDAIKRLSPSQIETFDMARRGVHNEGSKVLQDRLSDKVEMDFPTARRLFTLLCVLHFKG